MEKRLESVECIFYRRKVIEKGLILKRPEDRHYCSIKNEEGVKLSVETPHKDWRAKTSYLPSIHLNAGAIFFMRTSERAADNAKIQKLEVIEKSEHHAVFRVLDEREEPKRTRTQKTEKPLEAVYFQDEPLSPHAHKEEEKPKHRKQKRGIFGKEGGSALSKDQIKFCVEFGVFDRHQAQEIERGENLRYRQKSDLFFIFDPKNKGRNGSPYRKITPENVLSESFVYDGEMYDIITGRNSKQPPTEKPCPRFKRITTGVSR